MAQAMQAAKRNPLRSAQIGIAFLTVVLSAAVLGTAADVWRIYKAQKAALNPWWLPLWPDHFDTSGTPAAIGTATAILALNLVFTAVSFFPQLSIVQSPKLSALFTMLVAVPSFLLALFAIVFAHVLNTRAGGQRDVDTIQTWTCRFRSVQPSAGSPAANKNVTNAQFGKLCDESKFAFYGLIPIILLQSAMVAIAVAGWRRPVLTLPRSGGSAKEMETSRERSPSGAS